jgi:hypothetical protein
MYSAFWFQIRVWVINDNHGWLTNAVTSVRSHDKVSL